MAGDIVIPDHAKALFGRLIVDSFVDMPDWEAVKAPDVRSLFDMGLVAFVKSEKPVPAVRIVLTELGKSESAKMAGWSLLRWLRSLLPF